MSMEVEEIERAIEIVLDKIRPFLRRDGGDINLIGYRDGIVYVEMAGACDGCISAGEDIASGVEVIVMEEVPGVIAVRGEGVPEDMMEAYRAKKMAATQSKIDLGL